MRKLEVGLIEAIILAVLLITLGFLLCQFYNQIHYDKRFDGLYFNGNYNWSGALEHSYAIEGGGNWVCSNVKDLSYENAIKTCEHEVAHEIFAVYCSKNNNIDKCINLTK